MNSFPPQVLWKTLWEDVAQKRKEKGEIRGTRRIRNSKNMENSHYFPQSLRKI